MDWENTVKNGYTAESNLKIKCNPHQNSNVIFHRNTEINPEIYLKAQKTPNSQSNPG
jgi:hypothetical protein